MKDTIQLYLPRGNNGDLFSLVPYSQGVLPSMLQMNPSVENNGSDSHIPAELSAVNVYATLRLTR